MKKYLILFLILGLAFQSCKKEDVLTTEGSSLKSTNVGFRSNEKFEKTIIGKEIANPFLLENMQKAENNVYVSSAKTLSATDLYVEFQPRSIEDIILLEEADIEYFDFPLGHEIKVMGDIYQDKEGENMPILYAVVGPQVAFPDIPYRVISSLYLNEKDETIVAESFRLTGHFKELNKMDLSSINFPTNANTPLANPPICPDGETAVMLGPHSWTCVSCDPGFHLVIVGSPPFMDYDCVPDEPSGGGLDGSGCISCEAGHTRKPGGRVLVEDTELSISGNLCTYKPVKDVKVTVLSRFGWPRSTRTDDNGCWKIDVKRRGHIWTRVKFSNNRCRIRTTHKFNINVLWKWIVTHKSKFEKHSGPKFNDIDIVFNMWSDRGTNPHLNWAAATTNNAVHEFHSYATNEGIATPERLDIFGAYKRSDGYALMHSQDVLAKPLSSATASALALIPFLRPFKPLIQLGLRGAILAYLPEVMIGFDEHHSDQFKETVYHELGHASHYKNVNKNWWNKLVTGEVVALGHGNSNSLFAGRISLAESWANHIGKSFAHKQYGSNVSFPSIYSSFSKWLEKERNEAPNHIPKGYYNDLVDGVDVAETVGDGFWAQNNTGTLQDNVSGFTNSQMFSVLTPFVKSPDDFTDRLILMHLDATSNTESQVRNLFSFY